MLSGWDQQSFDLVATWPARSFKFVHSGVKQARGICPAFTLPSQDRPAEFARANSKELTACGQFPRFHESSQVYYNTLLNNI